MKVNKEWMNISDMMSGLMMVFLFISIAFMVESESEKNTMQDEKNKMQIERNNMQIERNKMELEKRKAEEISRKYQLSQASIKEIAMTYRKSQQSLNQDLHKEFEADLKRWGAEITQDNIFRFNSPDVLFKKGSSEITTQFKKILNDFFPRYIQLLTSSKYKHEIDEIRVEGHTSNIWGTAKSKESIYLNNMQLSQNRANNVLTYCYTNKNIIIEENQKWLEQQLRANGMSFAKLIYDAEGKQNLEKSRRVEFRVLTKAQEKIYKIIEQLQ